MKRTITPSSITVDTEYLEFFYQPQQGRVTAYLVRGYENAEGFHEVEREAITISGADYDELMAPNADGKQQGRFRNDDVLSMADRLKA